jgi:uncharacterized membrane protein/LysM repeat protein
MRTYLDLLLFAAVTMVTAALAIAFPEWQSPVRVALGLVVVLAAPGYALASALFPRIDDIDGVDRLAVTLGLSIAAVPLVGLALNATPWGIRLAPMAVGLTVFVLLFTGIAVWARARVGAARAFAWPWGTSVVWQWSSLATGVMVVLLGVPALAVALRPSDHHTEFYVLGSTGQLQSYPTKLEPGERFRLTLGITNREGVPISYRLGIPFDPAYANAVTTVIEPGDQWQRTLDLVAPDGQGRTKLEFELYRPEDDEPYRSLHLFVTLPGQTLFEGMEFVEMVPLTPIAAEGTVEALPGVPEEPAGTGSDDGAVAPGAVDPAPGAVDPAPSSDGDVSSTPSEPAGPTPTPLVGTPVFQVHVVRPGETLSGLARALLGSADRYPELFDLNRDRLTDPNLLPVGAILRLPVDP